MKEDRLIIYYVIGEGERLGVPKFEGLKVDERKREISIPVKAHITVESLVDNSWRTSDPQVGLLIREIQMMNGRKKEFKIWKVEVKTVVSTDELTEYLSDTAKTVVNIALVGLGIFVGATLIKKIFLEGKKG
ncbi:MAG: hypothetical protein IT569_05340 [Leptospiraceae bacterium]|nr:hypothetical protein [Leptospiraceae bacterium]